MIDSDNAKGKWRKMVRDEGLRTVECLRGRLLAERVASRVAKEDAAQMGFKLVELENQLRVEIKSRNKAERRLKFLLKKLESMNISHVSDDSEISSLLQKNHDMSSSVSSLPVASSDTKEPEEEEEEDPRTQIITNPEKWGIEDSSSQVSTSNSTDKTRI